MLITEEIQKSVQKLPPDFQTEILHFAKYLLEKAERENSEKERQSWENFSLSSAMRGMEDEETPKYTISDLKVVF